MNVKIDLLLGKYFVCSSFKITRCNYFIRYFFMNLTHMMNLRKFLDEIFVRTFPNQVNKTFGTINQSIQPIFEMPTFFFEVV